MVFGVQRTGVFSALFCMAFQAGGDGLEEQFREPAANAARPCVALTLDVARPDGEWPMARQLGRARDVGAGGVLLGVPVADGTVWEALTAAVERARRLGLEVGLRDFFLSAEEADAAPRAQRLVWTCETVGVDEEGRTLNAQHSTFNAQGSNREERAYREIARWAVPEGEGSVQPHQILDLAAGAVPTGGMWRVCRFRVAEVEPRMIDPFDRAALARHVNRWLSACQDRLGRTYGETLSWYQFSGVARAELAWPDDLPEVFLKRSGIGLARHLPALAGVAVGGETTAVYVRRQVAQTVRGVWRERFGKTVNELVHEAGLAAGIRIDEMPVEPVEAALYFRRPMLVAALRGDATNGAAQTECRMGGAPMPRRDANVLASGGARAMGRRQVMGLLAPLSAAPTPAAALLPFPWKHEADRLLIDGATRLVLEAGDGLPGQDEAFRQMRDACAYVHRCQVMLQQGEPVADLLVWAERPPPALAGYSCDYVNGVMLEAASVRDGKIRFESGREYGALAVGAEVQADPDAARMLRQMAARGVRVVQADPDATWTLWQIGERGVREGQAGETPAFPVPDFEWRSDTEGMNLRFLHRRTPAHEIYFVVNDSAETGTVACTFRDTGKGVPSRWEPASGEIGVIERDIRRGAGGRVTAALFLAPYDACFVVFER
jgi:hypothetical protein